MRLIDADALLENYDLKNAVKYGNKSAEQRDKSYSTLMMYEIADMIDDAPTIESPRPDWTPCEDGLPEKVDYRLWSKNVLATVEQKTGERYVIEAYFHYGHEKWKHDQYEDFYVGEVIAWQPIPTPYNPDRKEDAK